MSTDRPDASPPDAPVSACANPAADGSEDAYPAFTAIYQQYAPLLFAFFYRHLGHRQDAEDLTATTFSKVLSSIERYTEQGCFEAWLWSIARHTLHDAQRRRRDVIDIDHVAFQMIDPDPPVESQVLQAEQVAILLQLLRGLPADQRQVLLLRFSRECSFHEIARSLGRSIGAVKMLVQRALATLRTRHPGLEHLQFEMTRDLAGSAIAPHVTNAPFRLQSAIAAGMCCIAHFRWRVPQLQPLLSLQPAVVPVRQSAMYVMRRR